MNTNQFPSPPQMQRTLDEMKAALASLEAAEREMLASVRAYTAPRAPQWTRSGEWASLPLQRLLEAKKSLLTTIDLWEGTLQVL